MKSKADFLITAIVFLCAGVLLGGLIFSIVGNPLAEAELEFSADFEDITGVRVNTDVVYAGARVGLVKAIEHLEPAQRLEEDATVRVHLAITESVEIPANVEVGISSASVLGENHVALKRVDNTAEPLANGATLVAESSGSLLDAWMPGASDILADVEEVAENMNRLTKRLDSGEDGENLSMTLANFNDMSSNMKTLSADLKVAVSGEPGDAGLVAEVREVTQNLNGVVTDLKTMISGSEEEGAPPGMAARADVILGNFQEFSEELNVMVAGSEETGEPGLKVKINRITDEFEALLAGSPEDGEEGVRKRMEAVLKKTDNLLMEMQTLVVWGEYLAGALAEKPSRIVFSGKRDNVPTKEDILSYLEKHGKPFPVLINDADVRLSDETAKRRMNGDGDGGAADAEPEEEQGRSFFPRVKGRPYRKP